MILRIFGFSGGTFSEDMAQRVGRGCWQPLFAPGSGRLSGFKGMMSHCQYITGIIYLADGIFKRFSRMIFSEIVTQWVCVGYLLRPEKTSLLTNDMPVYLLGKNHWKLRPKISLGDLAVLLSFCQL
jgi:hypothetical protein